jgi:hypothetical protein
MDNEVRPLRVWNDGELCEYDTVTVGNRRLVVFGSLDWKTVHGRCPVVFRMRKA